MRKNRPAGRLSAARLRQWLLAISWALLALGCGGGAAPEAPAPVAANADVQPSTDSASAVATPAETAAQAIAAGEQALREQRLFLPVTDNAFELFTRALEADPANERADFALQDLVPYAVLHIEQRLAAEDADDAARVIALLQRAAGEAPALPRLQASLATLQARQVTLREAAEATAARATTPAPLPAPTASPAPLQAPPVALPVSEAVAVDDTAATSSEPPVAAALPAPTPAARAAEPPPPVAAPVPARVPEVVYRPALRYPPMAERRRIEGLVEIEFTISADGSVGQLEILRSEPQGMFDREALAAMERWRFAPPEAPLRARRTLEFKLAR